MHKLGVQLVHKPELWLSIIRSKRTQVTELWKVFFAILCIIVRV